MLHGRSQEQQRIRALLDAAAAGRGGAMHILGAAGIGKSALLAYAAATSEAGWTVLRCTGVRSEAQLAFAGLHLLVTPVQHRIAELPACQQNALLTAIGLATGRRPDSFPAGVSIHSLLALLAAESPVLCLIDDAHLLDRASVDALSFAARRLSEQPIAVLFAGVPDDSSIAGFPELRLPALDSAAARRLLEQRRPELRADGQDRLLEHAAGNPLALLELPAIPDDALPVGAPTLPDNLQSRFGKCALGQTTQTRSALLTIAAEMRTELATAIAALEILGSSVDALATAERTGMVRISGQAISFIHPLQRAAVYHQAPFTQRAAVHAALATALTDPDRRAWHLAEAATGPDEAAADALEAAAHRARRRTAYTIATAALTRSAELTTTPAEQRRRLLLAMDTAADAGRPEDALLLAERIPAHAPIGASDHARLLDIGARIEAERGALRSAHLQMLKAAGATAEILPARSARILVNAAAIAWAAGQADGVVAAHNALHALTYDGCRDHHLPTATDHLSVTTAMAALLDPDPAAGVRLAAQNIRVSDIGYDEPASIFALAQQAIHAGELGAARKLLRATRARCHHHTANWWLPAACGELAIAELLLGHLDESNAAAKDCLRLARRLDQPNRTGQAHSVLAVIAAIRGDTDDWHGYAEECLRSSTAQSRTTTVTFAEWALGLDDLVHGHYRSATERFEALASGPFRPLGQWVPLLSDWVEAAVRLGGPERAAQPMAEIQRWAAATDNNWIQAHLSRCHGLVYGDPDSFVVALDRYAAESRWYDHARTELLYGELLHRARARTKARTALRNSAKTFGRLGARPWVQRVDATLRAAGETTTDRGPDTRAIGQLTARELDIVRLAASGATNREIGERLWLSPKTVAHHLYRAFPKLGVTNRGALARLDLGTDAGHSERE
ncbi:AAA family ATPase [Nocardia cyriacigeorgica]|uniref:AAA family ATPase n=1 Tax=Nocardia cyriacigeorgica TaxID=135487 RepID=A0ABX0CVD5_9NOCA|nr:LuxR family transcriptional regulator [Nocardia cyriacigeorgica]NEW58611.1 AAA family ATPase [Nocardia cyriacigeorgica]